MMHGQQNVKFCNNYFTFICELAIYRTWSIRGGGTDGGGGGGGSDDDGDDTK